MNWTEIFGFVTGATSVLLAVYESAWNWPVGIANNIFFLILFWHAKLYADALLQIVYIVISIFGWWNWLFGGVGRSKLLIARTRWSAHLWLAVATVASTAGLTFLLRRFTDSNVPFGDGLTTALSLTAQYMLSKKLLENWWVWMTADVIYVALYCYKSLYLTGVLYAIFFAMCIVGYFEWRKILAQNRTVSPEVAFS
ncbi:MAG TPA: nicotinamide riboside transporter PnuC [Terriglobales bacterium]|nr:nicotinamide riboside transporter PnuC [Terriglobales bacterium]